jgi:hypothetical protein
VLAFRAAERGAVLPVDGAEGRAAGDACAGPLAADRTLLEAWAFQPVGAPDELLHSALLYNRQVFSPMSMVAHDDLHLFEGIQRCLAARGNPWVNLQRGAVGDDDNGPHDVSGIDEALLRNQYRAWADGMRRGAGGALP